MALTLDTVHLVFIGMLFWSPSLIMISILYNYVIIKPNRDNAVFRIRRPNYLGFCLVFIAIHMTGEVILSYLSIQSLIEKFNYRIISGIMLGVGSSTVIAVRLWTLWFDIKHNRIEQERLINQHLNKSFDSDNNNNSNVSKNGTNCYYTTCFVNGVNFFGNSFKILAIFSILIILIYSIVVIYYILGKDKTVSLTLIRLLLIFGMILFIGLNLSVYNFGHFWQQKRKSVLQDNETGNENASKNGKEKEKEKEIALSDFRDDYNIRIELTITTLCLLLSYILTFLIEMNENEDWNTHVTLLAIKSCLFHSIICGLYMLIPFHKINEINSINESQMSNNVSKSKSKSKSNCQNKNENKKKVSLRRILGHNRAFYLFANQLVHELCMENLTFLIELWQFKQLVASSMRVEIMDASNNVIVASQENNNNKVNENMSNDKIGEKSKSVSRSNSHLRVDVLRLRMQSHSESIRNENDMKENNSNNENNENNENKDNTDNIDNIDNIDMIDNNGRDNNNGNRVDITPQPQSPETQSRNSGNVSNNITPIIRANEIGNEIGNESRCKIENKRENMENLMLGPNYSNTLGVDHDMHQIQNSIDSVPSMDQSSENQDTHLRLGTQNNSNQSLQSDNQNDSKENRIENDNGAELSQSRSESHSVSQSQSRSMSQSQSQSQSRSVSQSLSFSASVSQLSLQARSKRFDQILMRLPWNDLPMSNSIETNKKDSFKIATNIFNKYIAPNAYQALNISGNARNTVEFMFNVLVQWKIKYPDGISEAIELQERKQDINNDDLNGNNWFENDVIQDYTSITCNQQFTYILLHVFDTALPDIFENLAGCLARFKTSKPYKEIEAIILSSK